MNKKAAALLDAFKDLPDGANVVEIGCVRFTEEMASDGFSTVYLAQEALKRGWMFNSVDRDRGAVNRARIVTQDLPVSVHYADGREWLESFPDEIDGLYLDGAMSPGEAVSQYRAAKLAKKAVIAIDDVQSFFPYKRGKGDLLLDVLEDDGWDVSVVETEWPNYKMAIARRG